MLSYNALCDMKRYVRAKTRFTYASLSLVFCRFGLCVLACTTPPSPLRAQQPPEQSSTNGWTTAWTAPLTPRETALRQLKERIAAAKKSRDFGPLLAECERAVRDHPNDLEAANALYAVHFAMKGYAESLADLDRISNISRKSQAPGLRFAHLEYSRSLIHQQQHDYAAEGADVERALQIDSTFYLGLNALAWLRATNPDPALQNSDEAVQLANRAVQSGGRQVWDLDTLAAAYAAQGKYSRAVSLEKEAIARINQDVVDAKKSAEFLHDASARLNLYTHDEPDRETPHDLPP